MEKPTFTAILSLLLIILTFAFIFMLFFITPPEANKDSISTVTGFLMGTGFAGVVGFWLGSSNGSEKKNETIKNLSEK